MQIAFNKNKERVHIKESKSNEEYFCPFCGAKLIRKMGSIYAHHFAHKNCECTDKWSHDMSDWHINWQNKFPKDCQEIVVKDDEGNIHRADVLVNDTVVEFQHSTISREEFEERNEFYNKCGYRVVWVFDMIEKFKNKTIEKRIGDKIVGYVFWHRPSKIFANFECNDKKAVVFFQDSDNNDDVHLWKVHKFNKEQNSVVDVLSTALNFSDFTDYVYKKENIIEKLYEQFKMKRSHYLDELFETFSDCYYSRDFKEKEPDLSPKTILELWDEFDKINYMIVKNVKTGIYVKFSKNPAEQFKKYGKVYGYIKKDEYSRYNKHSTDIFAANWKTWVLA